MKLRLTRTIFGETYTIGRLSVDGVYECDTLEDKCREIDPTGAAFEIGYQKVPGTTAIPSGTYKINITYSPRFQIFLPLLEDVPGFSGVRIHPGNSSHDTEGCILVGEYKNHGDWITNSQDAIHKLLPKLQNATDEVTITITNLHSLH